MHSYVESIFSLTRPEEEMWPGGAQPMLLPMSSCVSYQVSGILLQGYVWPKYFLVFLCLTQIEEGCGHRDVLNTLPRQYRFQIYIYMSLWV